MSGQLLSSSVGMFVILICGSSAVSSPGTTKDVSHFPTRQLSDLWCDGDSKIGTIVKDIHDGDMKNIWMSGSTLHIEPYGNNQTWIVKTEVQPHGDGCTATVDFNVPGKPNPPPVSLTATFFTNEHLSPEGFELVARGQWEFTDPTGTLAPKGFPLNRFVDASTILPSFGLYRQESCPDWLPPTKTGLFADLHDGDIKEVTISGAAMTIKPFGNNQTWVVKTELDLKSCTASVDFNVPGKPNPPSDRLVAKWWLSDTGSLRIPGKQTDVLEFYREDWRDPTRAKVPLNQWVKFDSALTGSSKNVMI